MTKQAVLKSIDKRITDIAYKTDGKLRYSRNDIKTTLQEIRKMVADIETNTFPSRKSTNMNENDIMNAVCSVMGLTKDEMLSHKRNAELIQARKIFSVCANQILGYKPPKIASLVGKDRTTVIFHLKNHDADMFSCKQYRNAYNRVCEILHLNNKNNQ